MLHIRTGKFLFASVRGWRDVDLNASVTVGLPQSHYALDCDFSQTIKPFLMEIPICSSSVSLFVETIGAVVQNDFALLLKDSGMVKKKLQKP